MPFESFKWKGRPRVGGVGPFRFRPRGATGTPRTLPQRPRPSVHKFRRRDAAPSQRLVEVPRGPATDQGSCRQPSRERPRTCVDGEVPSGSGPFGGARPHRGRLPWMYDSGRENPSICAAAEERWPLRATPAPGPSAMAPPAPPPVFQPRRPGRLRTALAASGIILAVVLAASALVVALTTRSSSSNTAAPSAGNPPHHPARRPLNRPTAHSAPQSLP